jgi:hypothetical protein
MLILFICYLKCLLSDAATETWFSFGHGAGLKAKVRFFANLIKRMNNESYAFIIKDKGAIAIVLKSMTHSAKPEVKGVVRTECQISGYYLRPTSETQTRLYFYSNVDLRGNMEDKIAQSFAIQRAAQVDKMAARFAKWRAQE